MEDRYSPSALWKLKGKVEERRAAWYQVTLKELESARDALQEELTDELLTNLYKTDKKWRFSHPELVELRAKEHDAREKVYLRAQEEFKIAKAEYQQKLTLQILARIQAEIDYNYVTLACKIAETRRENYMRHWRDSRAKFYENKLREPPTLLDDEEIRTLRIRAGRRFH